MFGPHDLCPTVLTNSYRKSGASLVGLVTRESSVAIAGGCVGIGYVRESTLSLSSAHHTDTCLCWRCTPLAVEISCTWCADQAHTAGTLELVDQIGAQVRGNAH